MPLYAFYEGGFEEAHSKCESGTRMHVRHGHRTEILRQHHGLGDISELPYKCLGCGGTMIVADGNQVPKYFRHLSSECSGGGDESEIHYDLALGLGDVFDKLDCVEKVYWDGEYNVPCDDGGFVQPDVTIKFTSGIMLYVEVVHKHPPEEITINTLGSKMIVIRTDQIPREDIYSGLAQSVLVSKILEYHQALTDLGNGQLDINSIDFSWRPEGMRASYNRGDLQFPRFLRRFACVSILEKIEEQFVLERIRDVADFPTDEIVWKEEEVPVYGMKEETQQVEREEIYYHNIEPPPAHLPKLRKKYDSSKYIQANYQDADNWWKFAELFGMDSKKFGRVEWFAENIRTKSTRVVKENVTKKVKVEIGKKLEKIPFRKKKSRKKVMNLNNVKNESKIFVNWNLEIRSRHQGEEKTEYKETLFENIEISPNSKFIDINASGISKQDIEQIERLLHLRFHHKLGQMSEHRANFTKHTQSKINYYHTPKWGISRKELMPFHIENWHDWINLEIHRRFEISRLFIISKFNGKDPSSEEWDKFVEKLPKWERERYTKLHNYQDRSTVRRYIGPELYKTYDSVEVATGDYEKFMKKTIEKWINQSKEILNISEVYNDNMDDICLGLIQRLEAIFSILTDDLDVVRIT